MVVTSCDFLSGSLFRVVFEKLLRILTRTLFHNEHIDQERRQIADHNDRHKRDPERRKSLPHEDLHPIEHQYLDRHEHRKKHSQVKHESPLLHELRAERENERERSPRAKQKKL